MDEVWVLAEFSDYEGFGEPGDVMFDDPGRYFFPTEAAANQFIAGKETLGSWVAAYKLTRAPAPIPDALPAVHSAHD